MAIARKGEIAGLPRLPVLSVESSLTLLAASTGLRVSECLGLQWQDYRLSTPILQMRYFRTAFPRSQTTEHA